MLCTFLFIDTSLSILVHVFVYKYIYIHTNTYTYLFNNVRKTVIPINLTFIHINNNNNKIKINNKTSSFISVWQIWKQHSLLHLAWSILGKQKSKGLIVSMPPAVSLWSAGEVVGSSAASSGAQHHTADLTVSITGFVPTLYLQVFIY